MSRIFVDLGFYCFTIDKLSLMNPTEQNFELEKRKVHYTYPNHNDRDGAKSNCDANLTARYM